MSIRRYQEQFLFDMPLHSVFDMPMMPWVSIEVRRVVGGWLYTDVINGVRAGKSTFVPLPQDVVCAQNRGQLCRHIN